MSVLCSLFLGDGREDQENEHQGDVRGLHTGGAREDGPNLLAPSSSAELSMHKCLLQLPSHRYLHCIAMGYLFCNTQRMGPGKGSRAHLFRELPCWGLGRLGGNRSSPWDPFPEQAAAPPGS